MHQLQNFEPVLAFSKTLLQMGSVLAFNEAIDVSRALVSWLGGFSSSTALLPAQFNFLLVTTVPDADLAAAVRADVDGRLLGECVCAAPRIGKLSNPTEPARGAFGGCFVGMQVICDSGRRQNLTSALLDAGMAEMQRRCVGSSLPTGVLSTTQSASFTTIAGVAVALSGAMTAVREVLDQFDPALDRYVMLLNIGSAHWAPATVSLLAGTVTMFDSVGGPSAVKSLIVSRPLVFARQAELRRRILFPGLTVEDIRWTVNDEVNQPSQRDGYNCGPFAFAYIWCCVCGKDFAPLPVVRDALRLSFIHFVLISGMEHMAQPSGIQQVAG